MSDKIVHGCGIVTSISRLSLSRRAALTAFERLLDERMLKFEV